MEMVDSTVTLRTKMVACEAAAAPPPTVVDVDNREVIAPQIS